MICPRAGSGDSAIKPSPSENEYRKSDRCMRQDNMLIWNVIVS